MLPEDIERFSNSGRTFSARQIVDSHKRIKERLIAGWITTLSTDSDGRESLYRQLRGLDSILDELIAGWSKE